MLLIFSRGLAAVVVDVIRLEGVQGIEEEALLLPTAFNVIACVLLATEALVQVQILNYVLKLVSLDSVA